MSSEQEPNGAEGASGPDVAVVIPSRRGPRLAFALEALVEQTIGRDRFEVVVARDPLSSGEELAAPRELSLRWIMAPEACGPTVKRNLAWRATTAPMVAFTDDDCRPAPDWLERLVAASAGDGRFVQGRTEPDPDEAYLLHGLARSQRIDGPSDWYQCCNMAYPRALLERLGGFDESFTFGSEDTDLALRAIAAGAEPAFAPDALVRHAVLARSLPAALREALRWPSQPLLLRRHPGHRRALYRGLFYRRSHALLLLAAAGALAARRHPAITIAAAMPYAAANLDPSNRSPRRIARQLAALPPRIAVDAAEVVANARAAVRHRVVAL